jgi:hypothetical protein
MGLTSGFFDFLIFESFNNNIEKKLGEKIGGF